MADRSVSVKLQADVSGYMASMRAAAKSTEDFVTRNRQEMETVGRGLLGIGTAAIGGLGLATKAAIDWESAWAGVTKTVDGSAAQMATLEDELRNMAKELPASHEEIAAVAEAAGQLGVSVGDVDEFTRTMIDLGETTNLTADQAATSLARFSNIMGTATSDVDRLGSTLVDLGNNSETTEAEILELGTRLAAAGQIAGLSESDVLGFAAAVTSVGVPAEAAGTALSKTFTKIRDAVLDGGDSLQTFAELAGMTSDEFATAFREDPAEAIAAFIGGLGQMNEAGQSTTGVLEELELTDERLKRTLLSTASAGDLLTDSLELGADAWEENTALSEEAEQRYKTASAQISIAWNRIRDAAIEVGSVVVPVVAGIAGAVGGLANAFGELPDGVDTAAAALLGVAGMGSLALGSLALLAPRVVEMKRSMEALGLTTGRTGKAMRGLGRAAGIGSSLLVVAGVLEAIHQASVDAGTGIGEMTEALLRLRRGEVTEAIDTLIEKQERIADRSTWQDAALGLAGVFARRHDAEEFSNELESVDQALAGLVQGGDILAAREAVEALGERLGLSGDEVDRWVERSLPEYKDALAGTRAEQQLAEESTGEFAGALDVATEAVEEQKTATEIATERLQEYQDQLRAMTDPVFALENALANVEDAQDAYNEAIEEHGKNSDEAKDASFELARQLSSLEQAAIDGDLSFDDFDRKLRQWTESGALTEDQAADIRDRVKEARGAAEEYQDDYAAHITLQNFNETVSELDTLERRAQQVARDRTIHFDVSGLPGGGYFGGLTGAHGGMVPDDLQSFPGGGFVTGPGGPRQDLVHARLSPGEFVVQAPAVSTLGVDAMREINRGRMPGSGGGGVFEGELYLDSGEFLGMVRGEVRGGIEENNQQLRRKKLSGAGSNR